MRVNLLKFRFVFLIFFSFFLSNCSGTGKSSLSHLGFSDKPSESVIYFTRPAAFAGSYIRAKILVDDKEAAVLGINEMAKFTVKPGTHVIRILSEDPSGALVGKDQSTLNVKPNSNYFFIVKFVVTVVLSDWTLTETSEEGFRKVSNF
jgi:hypothetical protein